VNRIPVHRHLNVLESGGVSSTGGLRDKSRPPAESMGSAMVEAAEAIKFSPQKVKLLISSYSDTELLTNVTFNCALQLQY